MWCLCVLQKVSSRNGKETVARIKKELEIKTSQHPHWELRDDLSHGCGRDVSIQRPIAAWQRKLWCGGGWCSQRNKS
jgi:hypothetical protein